MTFKPIPNPMSQSPPEPPRASAEKVIDAILATLEAYHLRKLDELREILSGFSDLSRPHLVTQWLRLQEQCPDSTLAKSLMTRHIMAQLDGGDGPVWS